jgi:hypothetical protein
MGLSIWHLEEAPIFCTGIGLSSPPERDYCLISEQASLFGATAAIEYETSPNLALNLLI